MMQSLDSIKFRFLKKSEVLRASLHYEIAASNELAARFCLIRLLDLWGAFSRELIIASAVGKCQTASGNTLPSKFSSQSVAAIAARITAKGKVGPEPRWHDATEALKAAAKLQPSNMPEISTALGSVGSPADPLRLIRNHFAHESSNDCWTKFAEMAWPLGRRRQTALQYLMSTQTGGIRLVDDWINELQLIASASVQ